MIETLCKGCQKPFAPLCKTQRYCSRLCRGRFYADTMGIKSPYRNIPTGTVGAIAEYRVTVDLLGRGYEVFKAASPACSCDLLTLKDDVTRRFEVRTAYVNKATGNLMKNRGNFKADGFAWVLPEEIIYEPPL